jgi:hypothetical protein
MVAENSANMFQLELKKHVELHLPVAMSYCQLAYLASHSCSVFVGFPGQVLGMMKPGNCYKRLGLFLSLGKIRCRVGWPTLFLLQL